VIVLTDYSIIFYSEYKDSAPIFKVSSKYSLFNILSATVANRENQISKTPKGYEIISTQYQRLQRHSFTCGAKY